MAIPTLTSRQKAARSTVALKALMAVSGLIMVLFLLAHMYGNLKVLVGQEAFDEYSHHLRTLGEPMLPHGGALWVIRIVLTVSVVAHIFSAVTLWRRSHRARGGSSRYQSTKARRGVQRSYASFTLRWGGVVVILFVIYHLLHLTVNVIHPGGASDSPYDRYVNGFQVWWVLLTYTIALIAVGFHLRHGFWSALTTLGANTSPRARKWLNGIAIALSLVITIGFLFPPFFVFFGLVG